jgi:hypothetical protein
MRDTEEPRLGEAFNDNGMKNFVYVKSLRRRARACEVIHRFRVFLPHWLSFLLSRA